MFSTPFNIFRNAMLVVVVAIVYQTVANKYGFYLLSDGIVIVKNYSVRSFEYLGTLFANVLNFFQYMRPFYDSACELFGPTVDLCFSWYYFVVGFCKNQNYESIGAAVSLLTLVTGWYFSMYVLYFVLALFASCILAFAYFYFVASSDSSVPECMLPIFAVMMALRVHVFRM